MQFSEYQKLAEVTSAFKGYTYQGYVDLKGLYETDLCLPYDWAKKAIGEKRLMAAAMGLAGEVSELLSYKANIEKETGDVFWYCAELGSCLGIELGTLENITYTPDYTETDDKIALCIKSGLLVDYLKKVTGHSHTLCMSTFNTMFKMVIDRLISFVLSCGFSVGDLLEKNIQKLRDRYGDKFSSAASINRSN